MGAALGTAVLGGCIGDEADGLILGEAESELARSSQALLARVKNIVVLCQENRSFDHYLGSRKLVEGLAVNGLTGTEWNPAPDGTPVEVFNLQDYSPADPPHEWNHCHAQWNGGANDGFVKVHAGPDQAEAMGYYVRNQIPIHHALADAYTTCDAYHCSVLGPTWPNRFYLHGGTSQGVKDNSPILGFKSIFDVLALAGIPALNYFSDVPWATAAYGKVAGVQPLSAFFAAAKIGKLPKFCIIDPIYFGPYGNDDHPAKDVRLGQALIATIYKALAQSPAWENTLFIVTYDEHGGFYDHVPPPAAADDHPDFQRLGFRVPTLAIGGRVRQGQTVSTVFDHASIVKTVLNRFGLAPWNARLAAAADMSSVLDPALANDPQPPADIPPVELSMSALSALAASWIPGSDHHDEIKAAADTGVIPLNLDHRVNDLSGIVSDMLDWGAQLGAIELLP